VSPDLKNGARAGAMAVPTFFAIFIAVGITAEVNDVSFVAALLMTALVFAAPAQFAMMDVANQTGIWLQVIAVGVLVNLRFFVMSMTLSTFFRPVSRPRLVFWAQFVSASSYLLTFFRSRRPEPVNLFDYFRGVVLVTYPSAIVGTAIGVWFGADLPGLLVFGAGLFLPFYFALLLMSEVKGGAEVVAALIGLLATPPLEIIVPGWGLLIAALGSGLVVVSVAN